MVRNCRLRGILLDIQASLSYFFAFWRSEGKILKLLIHDLPGKNREMTENPREKRGEDSLPESFYELDLSKLDFSKAAIPEADVSAFLHAAEIGPETEKASCRDETDRARWTVLSDTGSIRPCTGCFCSLIRPTSVE